jgi:hypothetical protein
MVTLMTILRVRLQRCPERLSQYFSGRLLEQGSSHSE